ncbi:hypothetical protein ACLI4Z_14285 [Natrialbaceae archaeon A-arb3/5]
MADEPPRGTTEASNEGQRRMTADPERIREWAERRDAVPVSTHGGEGHGHTFVRQGDIGEDHEEHTWDEFTETFSNRDLVFVYESDESTSEDLGTFDLVERDRAFERSDLGRDELEDKLRQGETVTTEIVETQVIEREIRERDTIESEVVDTEVADRHVVDSELLNREIVDTEFVTADVIEVVTDEARLDTVEEIERYTVESRVVDVEIDHEEDLERDEIETDVELESVQRSIVEGDLVQSDVTADEVIEREVIESKRGEGDMVRSELIERRTVEEEISERTRMQFTLEDTELVESEIIGSDVLDGEIIDVEEYESRRAEQMAAEDEVGTSTEGRARTEAGTSAEASADSSVDRDDADGVPVGTEADAPTPALSTDDQGKEVVDSAGQQIGIVAEVEDETAYIDPEPGLTDRLKARLNWGGHDDDEYPVESTEIREITDDELVVESERKND